MDKSYIGCYWSDRKEPASECAPKLLTLLAGLESIDPLFAQWFQTGYSSTPENPVPTDIPALTALLESGVNRTDFDNEIIPDLGFSFGFWNGDSNEDRQAGLRGTVGIYADNPGIVNSVVLDIPAIEALSPATFDLFIETWNPDWATWTTRPLRRPQGREFREFVGWETYLRSTTPTNPPTGVTTRPISDGIAIGFEKPATEVTVDDVLGVQAWLKTEGALTPVAD